MSSGSKATRGSASYRIHIIDPVTGRKKRRFVLGGNGTLLGTSGDTLIFSYTNAIVFFSASRGSELQEWTAKTLPQLFPQLSSGINDFSVDEDRKEIALTSLDGKKWILDIMSRSVVPYQPNSDNADKYPPTNKISISKYGISIANGKYGLRLVALCDKEGSEHQKILCGHNDVLLNNEEIFLDGKITAFSLKDSCFIVMHYETIARLKTIFTAMSLDGKRKLWEVRQSKLRPSDRNSETLRSSSCIDEPDGIYFITLKDEIMAISLKDGSILWRQIP